MLALQFAFLSLVCASGPASDSQDPVATPTEAAPTQLERCTEWGEEMSIAMIADDPEWICELVDFEALAAATTRGFDADDEFVKGFTQGVVEAECAGKMASGRVSFAGEEGARTEFLRVRGTEQVPTALIRMLNPDSSLTYIEFPLRVGADSIQATDAVLLSMGEPVSATYRRIFLPLALQRKESWLDRLLGSENLLAKNWTKFERVVKAAGQGKPDVLEKRVQDLPEELRRDKFVILLQVGGYDGEDPRYANAIGELFKHHPDDPATKIHAIDFHWLRGEHDLALAAVDDLDASLGGDPYLDTLAGGLLASVDRHEAAIARLRRSLERGMTWEDPYYTLIGIYIAQKDHARVFSTLVELDSAFEIEWNDLTEVPEYAAFAASPEYAQWLAHLAAKPKVEPSKD